MIYTLCLWKMEIDGAHILVYLGPKSYIFVMKNGVVTKKALKVFDNN
jgi:hypothetical protein